MAILFWRPYPIDADTQIVLKYVFIACFVFLLDFRLIVLDTPIFGSLHEYVFLFY